MCSVRWSDVHVKSTLLSGSQQCTHGQFGDVKTDAGKRTVGLDRDVFAVLREWKLRQGGGDLALPSSTGAPMAAANFLNREFRRTLKDAGPPAVTAHSLRHSFASIVKSHDAASSVGHESIGHSNYGTTMKLYGSVSSETRINAAVIVGDAIRGRTGEQLGA